MTKLEDLKEISSLAHRLKLIDDHAKDAAGYTAHLSIFDPNGYRLDPRGQRIDAGAVVRMKWIEVDGEMINKIIAETRVIIIDRLRELGVDIA